jgi:hypothetical protein
MTFTLSKSQAAATTLAPIYAPPPLYSSDPDFHWNPVLVAGKTVVGKLYTRLVTTSTKVLKTLNEDPNYDTVTMEGVFWLHGESDAMNAIAARQYLPNLIAFINFYRVSINTMVPFYLGMLSNSPFWGADAPIVRYAQVVAANYPGFPDVFAVETSGFSRYPLGSTLQGHFDTRGLIDLGNMLGEYAKEKKNNPDRHFGDIKKFADERHSS